MALPGSFNKVNVRARYVDLAGDPVDGSLAFTPTTSTMTAAGELTTVIGRTLTVPLILGVLNIDLPATDDPDITPTGFAYAVEERFTGLRGRTYTLVVPVELAGSGMDLSLLAPQGESTVVVQPYVLTLDGGTPTSTYSGSTDGGST